MTNVIQFPLNRIEKGVHSYYPEMNERKANCQMESSLNYSGSHYYIDTALEIKGRGITFIKQYASSDLTDHGQRKVGWNQYKVTKNAHAKLQKEYSISNEILLD